MSLIKTPIFLVIQFALTFRGCLSVPLKTSITSGFLNINLCLENFVTALNATGRSGNVSIIHEP